MNDEQMRMKFLSRCIVCGGVAHYRISFIKVHNFCVVHMVDAIDKFYSRTNMNWTYISLMTGDPNLGEKGKELFRRANEFLLGDLYVETGQSIRYTRSDTGDIISVVHDASTDASMDGSIPSKNGSSSNNVLSTVKPVHNWWSTNRTVSDARDITGVKKK